MMKPRHFIDLKDHPADRLQRLVAHANALKHGMREETSAALAGKSLAMIFEKPSTRTRVSFEVAIKQLGGHAVVLSSSEMQLGRGETLGDTARVLSRYVDGIMIRTNRHDKLNELADAATVPVINGLTDRSHPCQVLADIATYEQHRGKLRSRVVAWLGDANNVATSWVEAASAFDFTLRIACPEAYRPSPWLLDWAQRQGGRVEVTNDPMAAAKGAHLVTTDTWVSMGDADAEARHKAFEPFRVTPQVMAAADKTALFMHCLPAHRGEEVAAEVMDGPQSVVFDEAENRLHVQKAILLWTMGGGAA
jgi:ornithine carbamoyltransferase